MTGPALAPYWGIFRMRLIAGMQYRAAAWAGIATQFFWGGIELLIFLAFYRSTDAVLPLRFSELADLVWLRQAFLALVMLWAQDNELLEMTSNGDIAYEFLRPLGIYPFWYCRLLAYRVSRALLRCFPILVVAFFLPEPFRFHLPPNAVAAFLFLLAMIQSALLVTALSMLVCLLTCLTLSPSGTRLLIGTIAEFFMGALIPIPFMSSFWQKLLYWLPFRYTADFPFRVYSGNIAGDEALTGILLQFFWIIVIVSIGIGGFALIRKRIVIQGG